MRRRLLIAVLACVTTCPLLVGQTIAGVQSSSQTPQPVLAGTAKLSAHYDSTKMLRLAFALKPPHLEEEQQLIKDLHDKKSPQFHRFLTAEQWNARFAPSVQDEQAVVD